MNLNNHKAFGYLFGILLISLNLFFSINTQAQKLDSSFVVKSSIDSSEKLLHTAGVDLMRYSKQLSVGHSLNLLGTIIIVFGVSKQSKVTNDVNMLIPFGAFVATIGSVITLLSPRHVRYAGSKLRRVKLRDK